MLLLNLKKYNAVLAIPLVLLSTGLTTGIVSSKEENSANFHQAFSNLIESASKENKHLLDGWNEYIIKVLGYSNAEHLKVIEALTMDYAKSYKAFDEKYGKDLDQDKIKYTPQWLDDLVLKFGKDFVCHNRKTILMNLIMAFDRCDAKKYDQDAKEIISKELVLYLAYERYLDVFMKYYNKLNEKDRKKMKAWKEVAEKYLSITKTSHFAFIYYGKRMENRVRDNAMQKENALLYMYFKKMDFPFGGGALSLAMKDMDIFIEKCK
jgi:hypothetical protein